MKHQIRGTNVKGSGAVLGWFFVSAHFLLRLAVGVNDCTSSVKARGRKNTRGFH